MTQEEREEIEVQLLLEMAHRYGEQWRSADRELRERREAAKQRRRELAGVQTAPASQNDAQNDARNAKPASQPPSAQKNRDKPPSARTPKDPAAVRRRKAARRKGARHG